MKIPNVGGELCNAWIVSSDPQAVTYLSELSRLAGLQPWGALTSGGPAQVLGEDGDVLIVDARERDLPLDLQSLPRVTVLLAQDGGEPVAAHDVLLPGEEADFLRLLADVMPRNPPVTSALGRAVLVGGWHGGGGSTTAAMSLARSSKSVLLDAAGNRGGWLPEEEGVSWGDLNIEDLPPVRKLVAALPRTGGVTVLGPDMGKPLLPDAELVIAVLSAMTHDVVVDCGTNLDALDALARDLEAVGKPVSVVLVGRASVEGVRSLGQVWAGGAINGPVIHLLSGRKDRLFLAVAHRYGLRWRSFPRAASARWRKIQEEMWAA